MDARRGEDPARRTPISALDDGPPEPYVREIRRVRDTGNHAEPWHIAIRVLTTGRVLIRCQLDPLAPRLEWSSIPPEASLDEVMCPQCLSSGHVRQPIADRVGR